jgi:Fic-DOC domain mobile mystery protein B
LTDQEWLDPDDGAPTPLTPDDREGLVPTHITLRSELNEFEQRGVLAADVWAFGARRRRLLDKGFIRRLHRRMFGMTWRWAGQYRTTGKNIGVEAWQVPTELRKLLDDARYWIEHKTYTSDEIAVRFHHRLVQIHPFPNGNGRLSRLMADLLITEHRGERFSWGRARLVDAGDARTRYITALRAADAGDLAPLIAFARS